MKLILGIVDCLQAAKVNITGVLGIGLSEIVACYVDNSLTREQCMRIAHIIGQVLEDHSKNNGKYFIIEIIGKPFYTLLLLLFWLC